MFKWYSYFTTENFFQNLFLSESSRNQIIKISTFKYLLVVYICSEQKIFIVANRSTVLELFTTLPKELLKGLHQN